MKEVKKYSSEIVYFFDLILSTAIGEEKEFSPLSNNLKKILNLKNQKKDKKINKLEISPLNFTFYFASSETPSSLLFVFFFILFYFFFPYFFYFFLLFFIMIIIIIIFNFFSFFLINYY